MMDQIEGEYAWGWLYGGVLFWVGFDQSNPNGLVNNEREVTHGWEMRTGRTRWGSRLWWACGGLSLRETGVRLA